MLNFNIQSHKPLRELVYEEMRNAILTGEIKPGTRMMEIELAESLGVSRTPVREAIRKLEREGLVSIEPRKGAYVSDISPDDMVSILEVRETLEGLATYLATQKMSEEQLAELREAKTSYRKALEASNMNQMIETDTTFHHLIVQGSGNKYLIEMCQTLQDLVLRFRYVYFTDFKRAEEVAVEHETIFKGIEQRNGNRAREGAILHIQKLKEVILTDNDFQR